MRWEARTNYVEVKVGTRLFIYQTPQISGEPTPRLIGNHPLQIETARQQWISAEVENATLSSAILVMPNGVRYQITPRRDDEFDSGIVFSGNMHGEDWIVRSQIV